MKATITDDCIGCGRCVEICPEVYEMGAAIAQVKVNPIPADAEETAREGADECPVDAIVIEE